MIPIGYVAVKLFNKNYSTCCSEIKENNTGPGRKWTGMVVQLHIARPAPTSNLSRWKRTFLSPAANCIMQQINLTTSYDRTIKGYRQERQRELVHHLLVFISWLC